MATSSTTYIFCHMSNFSEIYYNFIIPQILFMSISLKKSNLLPPFSPPPLHPQATQCSVGTLFWVEQEIINHIPYRQHFTRPSISAHNKKDPPQSISSLLFSQFPVRLAYFQLCDLRV